MSMIPEELLTTFGARKIKLNKDEFLFAKDTEAHFYYQVSMGTVKMVNYNYDGQEFILGMFKAGQSFGEPPLFGHFPYPANAVAVEDCEICKLPRDNFFRLLEANFDIHRKFNYELSNRLRYKGMILSEVSSYPPEHRILTLVNYLKAMMPNQDLFTVPYTRQQLADMTGLRVETVIRTIKKMEQEGKIKLKSHKIIV
ncbi:MAG: Crp/Fnr family transcriptional regulator [Imperialibacter sp.]|uniref:Crp/Fnr family transcriptional regulator n=1 Tax=Imperialibacter sp. TaxID=2038411 RepID=UPI0032EBA82B